MARQVGTHVELVRQQMARVARDTECCEIVSARGLGHVGDQIHFDNAGLQELGRRYAAAWQRLAEKAND